MPFFRKEGCRWQVLGTWYQSIKTTCETALHGWRSGARAGAGRRRRFTLIWTKPFIQRTGRGYLIRVKDRNSNGILSALSLPDTSSFDIDVHQCLTQKQTKLVRAQGDRFHFLPKKAHFVFLNLHDQLFYDMDFRVVRFEISENNYVCTTSVKSLQTTLLFKAIPTNILIS